MKKEINELSRDTSSTDEMSEKDFANFDELTVEAIEDITCNCGWHTATVKNGKAICDNCKRPKY